MVRRLLLSIREYVKLIKFVKKPRPTHSVLRFVCLLCILKYKPVRTRKYAGYGLRLLLHLRYLLYASCSVNGSVTND